MPNAGVSELGSFDNVSFSDGKPVKPDTRTIEVNLNGVLYSMSVPSRIFQSGKALIRNLATHLALHYLSLNRVPGSFKAVVLIGSMGMLHLWIPKDTNSEPFYSILEWHLRSRTLYSIETCCSRLDALSLS